LYFLIFCLFIFNIKLSTKIKQIENDKIWLTEKITNSIDRITTSMLEKETSPRRLNFLEFLNEERNCLVARRDKDRFNKFEKEISHIY